jgi:hypothetical protein
MANRAARDLQVCPRFIRQMMEGRIVQTELARRLDRTQGYVSKVLAGVQPVPLDEVETWAAALELTADQAALFARYAIRSYGAPCANDLVDALDDAKARMDALDREVAAQAVTIDTLKRYSESLEAERNALRAELAAYRATDEERRRSV